MHAHGPVDPLLGNGKIGMGEIEGASHGQVIEHREGAPAATSGGPAT
jgi:hypothetical protein